MTFQKLKTDQTQFLLKYRNM